MLNPLGFSVDSCSSERPMLTILERSVLRAKSEKTFSGAMSGGGSRYSDDEIERPAENDSSEDTGSLDIVKI